MSLRATFEDSAVSHIGEILDEILPYRQSDLDRQVARATGESVTAVHERGFVPLTPFPHENDPEDLIVDWDELDLHRNVSLVDQFGPSA